MQSIIFICLVLEPDVFWLSKPFLAPEEHSCATIITHVPLVFFSSGFQSFSQEFTFSFLFFFPSFPNHVIKKWNFQVICINVSLCFLSWKWMVYFKFFEKKEQTLQHHKSFNVWLGEAISRKQLFWKLSFLIDYICMEKQNSHKLFYPYTRQTILDMEPILMGFPLGCFCRFLVVLLESLGTQIWIEIHMFKWNLLEIYLLLRQASQATRQTLI